MLQDWLRRGEALSESVVGPFGREAVVDAMSLCEGLFQGWQKRHLVIFQFTHSRIHV